MRRTIIFAEGNAAGLFDPLDQIRPPFLLRNGVWTVAERWTRLLKPNVVYAGVRPWLRNCVAQSTGWKANETVVDPPDDIWIICGTASPSEFEFWKDPDLPPSFASISDADAVIRLSSAEWSHFGGAISSWLQEGGMGDCPCNVAKIDEELPLFHASGLWDLVDHLGPQLQCDWALWQATNPAQPAPGEHRHHSSVLIGENNLWVAPSADLGPHTVIDASTGPIVIDSGAKIEPFSRLCGPAYIGPHTQLVGGKFTGLQAGGRGGDLNRPGIFQQGA